MKNIANKRTFVYALIILICALFTVLCALPQNTASAASTAYAFDIADYKVTYDIGSNSSIKVSEELTIDYNGYLSTGFIRDIPVNSGAQVKKVDVKKIVNGSSEKVYFDVYSEYASFLSVDIGDDTIKTGKSETYLLTYVYNITNGIVNKGMLPIVPIGTGWDCDIENAEVTLIVPKGYKDAVCYVGKKETTQTHTFAETAADNGKTRITVQVSDLAPFEGVTFDLNFDKGTIKSYFDFTPYYFILGGVAILVLIFLIKLFTKNKDRIIPVVNFEAPEKHDPLLMGKLIDSNVDSEDISSMLFYWADKGYIKIDLTDSNDPTLIRIIQTLPDSCEDYEKLLYSELFGKNDIVKTSSLVNSFYRTVNKVKSIINGKVKGLYEASSITGSVLMTVLGVLLIGLAPLLLALLGISAKYLYLAGFVGIIPIVIIHALARSLKYYSLKGDKKKKAIICAIIAGVAIIFGAYLVLSIPYAIIQTVPKILLLLIGFAISACSAILITRTNEYTEKLNDIIGFKMFIELTEKDKLEKMIETDPQFYYHILPYAQVLGVSDVWEDKFKDITIAPPDWSVSSNIIEFHIINRAIRTSTLRMATNFVSKPSSSGRNGGHGGGFGGGGGRGFGGGGGRGR